MRTKFIIFSSTAFMVFPALADCNPQARTVLSERFSPAQIDVLCGVAAPDYTGTPFEKTTETGKICNTKNGICSLATVLPVHAPCACSAEGAVVSGTVVSNKLCGQSTDPDIDQTKDPDRYGGFSGIWTGTWSNSTHLCGGLILKGVEADGSANVLYVYGAPGKVRWTQLQKEAAISLDGKLTFEDNGGHYTFQKKSDSDLIGTFEPPVQPEQAKPSPLKATFKREN